MRSWEKPRPRRRSRLWLLLFALLGLGLVAALARQGEERWWEGEELGGRDPFKGEERRRRARRAKEEREKREKQERGGAAAWAGAGEEYDDADEGDADEEAALEGETVWIAGPAGNLFVRDGGADSGLLPVLFVHSLGGNGGQWSLQLDHLRRERRAAAVDLRGHGDSDPADDGDYSVAALAADVAAAADQLALRRFVLAGHSLGGAVAIEYAGRHPERVAGLLLVDPNGDQTQVPAEQMGPFVEALRKDPLQEMDWYFRQLVAAGDAEVGRWVLEDLALTDEAALVGGIEGATRFEPLPALARYPGPKVSIVSEMNTLPFSLHRLVPDLPVRLLSGTGHWLQMDRPEPFNRLMDEFLAEVEGGQGQG